MGSRLGPGPRRLARWCSPRSSPHATRTSRAAVTHACQPCLTQTHRRTQSSSRLHRRRPTIRQSATACGVQACPMLKMQNRAARAGSCGPWPHSGVITHARTVSLVGRRSAGPSTWRHALEPSSPHLTDAAAVRAPAPASCFHLPPLRDNSNRRCFHEGLAGLCCVTSIM